MPIRKRFTPRVPFEVEFALQGCNNGIVYGDDKSSVEALLAGAEEWDCASREAKAAGKHKLAGVFSRHSARYLHAAEVVDRYKRSRR